MEILQQLGELFLQAVPTVILLFLFYWFLKVHFFRPMEQVLAERTARTEGARREAESAQAAALVKLTAYQEALRKARAEIYAEQDARRRKLLEERTIQIRETRTRLQEEIRRAKERIGGELASARIQLERDSPTLANDIVRVILERPGGPGAVRSEAR